jgi:hypothetical protein
MLPALFASALFAALQVNPPFEGFGQPLFSARKPLSAPRLAVVATAAARPHVACGIRMVVPDEHVDPRIVKPLPDGDFKIRALPAPCR